MRCRKPAFPSVVTNAGRTAHRARGASGAACGRSGCDSRGRHRPRQLRDRVCRRSNPTRTKAPERSCVTREHGIREDRGPAGLDQECRMADERRRDAALRRTHRQRWHWTRRHGCRPLARHARAPPLEKVSRPTGLLAIDVEEPFTVAVVRYGVSHYHENRVRVLGGRFRRASAARRCYPVFLIPAAMPLTVIMNALHISGLAFGSGLASGSDPAVESAPAPLRRSRRSSSICTRLIGST